MSRWRLLPPETSSDARILLLARGTRAFGDGFVSILLPHHLGPDRADKRAPLLALWLFQHFGLSVGITATVFFWTGLLSAFSALLAVRVASRIGLLNTAVFTHLPANLCLILTPFTPRVELAVLLLLLRSAFSQMDVPVRNSYVMAVVTPAERPAAASVTAVPKSVASAVGPLIAGWLYSLSVFGWPLVLAGTLKETYDLLLFWRFRTLKPRRSSRSPAAQADPFSSDHRFIPCHNRLGLGHARSRP